MTDNHVMIQLGRRHHFNVLSLEIIKETEKALQFQSVFTNQKIWMPKKALLQDKEVPGIFNLASWFRFDEYGARFLGHNMRHIMSTTWIR